MRTWNGPNGLLPGKSWFRNLLDEMSITLILETLRPMLCYNAMLQCLYVIMLQRNSAMSGNIAMLQYRNVTMQYRNVTMQYCNVTM